MLFWGMFAPIFGLIADKLGGNKAVFIGFIIFGLGIYMLYAGPNTGIYFQISLGVLVGIALGATATGFQYWMENIILMKAELLLLEL